MNERNRKSMRYSFIEGMFSSVMTGMTDSFVGPYALAMRASTHMIGILASAPSLLSSFSQLGSAWLVEKVASRKRVVDRGVLMGALMWIPIMLIPYALSGSLYRVDCLILCYALAAAFGAISFPPYSSMISEYVGERERGSIFGLRNKVCGTVNVTSMLLAGLLLFFLKRAAGGGQGEHAPIYGFTALFSIAFVARLTSWYFLRKMHDPPLVIRSEHRFTFPGFVRRLRKTNFGRFVISVAFMNMFVFIASPFFMVYMIKGLRFDYLTYTIVNLASTVTMLCTTTVWGRHADAVGNVRILKFCALVIPFIPIVWLFSAHPLYLILVQIVSGFFWGGFNQSASFFIYDAVTPEKRTRCIAYFNTINGLAIFAGAMVGGVMADRVPNLFGHPIMTLFLISGLLRFIASAFLQSVGEVRKVRAISNRDLFSSIIGINKAKRAELFDAFPSEP